ncbi:MAG: tetratricopeptide repeat protein, partial [Aliifodinibius sp.]|nr:tetratricopeptide repeat protein [Nitrosopumilaceae archaeon]NIV13268.1 tetratricopeptide repeat protein [Fodinibius sp.]NIX61758.1 tetratricopeptide repeat protein [Nitrosopumilaceae archaeon]
MDEQLAKLLVKRGKYLAFQSFTTNSGYEDGLRGLETAIKIADSLDNKKLLADALLFTGFTLYSRKYNTDKGDYETPLDYFQQSLQLRQEIEDLRGVSEALIYTGIIHERQGDEETALSHYRKALELSDKYSYKLEKSYATRHIAFILAAHDDLEGALINFKESLSL